MKKADLLKNPNYWTAKIQTELFRQLSDYMIKKNINKSQLAKQLGVSKGYITQVLKGDCNHRLSTIVELSLAIGKVPAINFTDLNQLLADYEQGIKNIKWNISIQSTVNKTSIVEESSRTIEGTTKISDTSYSESNLLDYM